MRHFAKKVSLPQKNHFPEENSHRHFLKNINSIVGSPDYQDSDEQEGKLLERDSITDFMTLCWRSDALAMQRSELTRTLSL